MPQPCNLGQSSGLDKPIETEHSKRREPPASQANQAWLNIQIIHHFLI